MNISKHSDSQSPEPPSSQELRKGKIFPRNLTARAAYIVPGNPTNTRPEDAVDNSFPGLEMDARNLQKYFFPGLYFEVYRDDGARLAELTPADRAKPWKEQGLKEEDITNNLYLWILKGKTTDTEDADNPPNICFFKENLKNLGGLYIWRRANALFPGTIAVVIGPNPPNKNDESFKAAEQQLDDCWFQQQSCVKRDDDDKLKFAILIAERSPYLNDQGVIDPDVYKPGELTRTLCTPWTYDFRDCQCFYWASNKPDVNSSEDGKYEYLNFQRKNWNIEPQTEDIANSYEARRLREIDYAEMMTDWQQLRPVVNGRECGESYKPPYFPSGKPLTLQQIKEELTYLASVEHALAVQYLYAYYSVNAPFKEPKDQNLENFRIWKAANEIFQIAIDEMRHLRWANQVLKLLGAETTVKRAFMIGRRFNIPFYLQSLTSSQLQWFIDVEQPSRSTLAGLDGMYIGIQESLQNLSPQELDPEKQRRAVEIVKLIIDEGERHYVRFSTAQQNLAFYDDASRNDLPKYIRNLSEIPDTECKGQWCKKSDQPTNPVLPNAYLYGVPRRDETIIGSSWQKQSDVLYWTLLVLLKVAFDMQDEQISGFCLRKAISLMLKMNQLNFRMAEKGITPLFTTPTWPEIDSPITCRQKAYDLLAKAERELADSGVISITLRAVTTEAPSLARKLSTSKVLQNPILAQVLQTEHNESIEEVFNHFKRAIAQTKFFGE